MATPPGEGTIPNGASPIYVRTTSRPLGSPFFTGSGWAQSFSGGNIHNAGASGVDLPDHGVIVVQVIVNGVPCPRRWMFRID